MKKYLLLFSIAVICGLYGYSQTTIFSQNFDGIWTNAASLSPSWSGTTTPANNEWHMNTYTTGWSGTSGSYSPTGASSTTQSARFHSYDAASGSTGEFITPAIDFSTYANYKRLTLYHLNTSGTDVLNVYLSTDNGGTWGSSLVTIGISSTWTQYLINLGSTTATQVKIKFTATSDFGTTDIGIDQVLIQDDPSFAPLNGIYTIDPAGSGSTNFTTFTSAINNLNGSGISGAVTFNVASGAVFSEKPPAITATGTSVNTIIFQKSGSLSNPKLVPTGTLSSSPYDFGICIAGGDYITFDGIDIDASGANSTTTAIEFGYLIRNASATNGAQYNTIKNCSVTLNKNYIASTGGPGSCIFSTVSSTGGGIVPTNATGANSYNKYHNLTLQNAQNGVYLIGNTSYPDLACEIGVSGTGCQAARNTISNMGGVYTFSAAYGIYTSALSGAKIFNNDISNIRSNQSTTAGILCASYLGTSEIYNNKVSDVSNSGSTSGTSRAVGIEVQNSSGTPTIRVYNNFVADIKSPFTGTATATVYAYGIYANNTSTATVAEIDNNSVHLFVTGTPTYSLACFAIANASTAIHKVRGNIFVNAVGAQGSTARHTCWYSTSATAIGGAGSVSNYNDLYIKNDAGVSGYVGRGNTTYYTTVANWNTATTQDANSVSLDPAFAGTSNLHASAAGVNAVSGFSPQSWVTTDIDCDDRATTSPADLGADAFNLASCAQPTGLTASNITYTTADLSWTAPGTGTPLGYEWEVRTSGAGGSGSTGLVASGSTTAPTVTASVSGLSGGTTYSLYVRTWCGGTDYSIWGGNAFSTLSCNVPTGVAASGVTSTGATISWIAPVAGSPAGYEWEVRSSGAAGSGATGLDASGTTTSPIVSATVSGLSAATSYSVYVRTVCYTGFNSSWTTAVTFVTQCNPEVAPTVVQDFTTYSGTAPAPVCWSEATGTLAASSTLTYGSSEWTSSTGFANTGTNKGVKVNLYSTGNDWIISQPIDLGSTPGLYRVKFNMAVTGYNSTSSQSTLGTHRVDIVVSTDGGSTWSNANIIKTYTGSGTYSNTGQIQTADLTAYSGVVKIAVVETTSSSSPDIDFHFDDFVVEALPSCNEPTALTASSVTLSTATISWTAPTVGTPTGYEWEVRTSGAAGSGSTGLVSSGSTTVGVTTANLTGLTSNTTHYFYARTNCGSGSFSPWAGPGSFYTGYCLPAPSSVDGNGIIKVVYSSVSNTTGVETGNYGNYSALVGPVEQGTSIPVAITFATGYTYDTKIWIDWNDDLDFNDSGEEVYSGTSTNINPTTLNASFLVPVTATLGNHRMRIGGVDVGPPTPCYTGTYGSFEDYTVNVVPPPTCPATSGLSETNITSNSADLSWTENGSASMWDIEYGISGFTPTGSASPGYDNVSKNDALPLVDLSPATTYSWYVRADCSGDDSDVSLWSGPHTFSTLCEVANIPYAQNFESVTVPAIPICTSIQNAGTGNNWLTANNPGSGFTTKVLEYPYHGTSPANAWFYTQGLNLTEGLVYRITFKYGNNSSTFTEKMKVAYGISPVHTDMSYLLIDLPSINQNALQNASVDFIPSSSGVFYFGFNCYSATDQFNLYLDDILIDVAPSSTTWNGAVGNTWTNAANWSNGVPGPYTNVILPGGLMNYPTLTAAATCKNFTIQSGSVGTGSILGNSYLTINGTTTVERFLTKYDVISDFMFHFLSAPVSGQAIVPGFQTLSSTNTDFYKWGETANMWINSLSAPGTWNTAFESTMAVGTGYLVAYPVDLTKTFSGILNDGDVSPALTNTPAGGAGWNLIGNPYPSAIDWDNVGIAQYSNLDNAVYVWDNANQSYKTWVAGTGDLTDGIIPEMQGFFVKANAASPALTLKNDDRVHGGSAFYKHTLSIDNLVHLKVEGNNHYDQTFIRFNESASNGFDSEWDAFKLPGGTAVPNFYSKTGDTKFAVNTLPTSSLNEAIDLDLVVGVDGDYTLNLVGNTLSSNYYVTLEDRKTGIIQKLNNNPVYTFNASSSDDLNRFRLHFKDATSVAETGTAAPFTIYSVDGIINILSDKSLSGEVYVYDMAGRMIKSVKLVAGTAARIDLQQHTGVYMVSVNSSEGMYNQKVLVK